MGHLGPRLLALAAIALALVAGVAALGVTHGTALVTNLAGIGWVAWVLARDERTGA